MFHLYHDLLLDFQKLTYPKLIRLRDGGNGLHQHITAHFFANGMSKDISGCSFCTGRKVTRLPGLAPWIPSLAMVTRSPLNCPVRFLRVIQR